MELAPFACPTAKHRDNNFFLYLMQHAAATPPTTVHTCDLVRWPAPVPQEVGLSGYPQLEIRVLMLVPQVLAIPIQSHGRISRQPEPLGNTVKVDFTEIDVRCLSFQPDFVQWCQQVGAEADDLVAVRINPG
jgi:hypothetical protein